MGSLTSPKTARHHTSPSHAPRICLWRGLRAYPRTTTAWAELPSCVTPSLAYYPLGSHAHHHKNPKVQAAVRMVSIRGFSVGAYQRVREYQHVVHLLRLSASPYVPTYPGRLNLPQEPLVIRRRSFSLLPRYSCLHSHSRSLHHSIPRRLHRLQDAPLPTHTPTGASATASAVCLSPATLSARNHLTSELLRTLSRMAASKPTSWLSRQLHILFHLAHASGP